MAMLGSRALTKLLRDFWAEAICVFGNRFLALMISTTLVAKMWLLSFSSIWKFVVGRASSTSDKRGILRSVPANGKDRPRSLLKR